MNAASIQSAIMPKVKIGNLSYQIHSAITFYDIMTKSFL